MHKALKSPLNLLFSKLYFVQAPRRTMGPCTEITTVCRWACLPGFQIALVGDYRWQLVHMTDMSMCYEPQNSFDVIIPSLRCQPHEAER